MDLKTIGERGCYQDYQIFKNVVTIFYCITSALYCVQCSMIMMRMSCNQENDTMIQSCLIIIQSVKKYEKILASFSTPAL